MLQFTFLVEWGIFVLYLGITPFRLGIDGVGLLVLPGSVSISLAWPLYSCFAIPIYATCSLFMEDFKDKSMALHHDDEIIKNFVRRLLLGLRLFFILGFLAVNTWLLGLYLSVFQLANSIQLDHP